MKKKLSSAAALLTAISILVGCSGAQTDSAADAEASAADTEQTSVELSDTAEDSPYDGLFDNDILTIEITATEEDWEYLMENATDKPWITADVTVNGETLTECGIKTKGNTSLSQVATTDSDRYSLKISFGKYVDGQTLYGLDKLTLNNIYGDSTYLKEYMSYDLFSFMDVPSSLCTFADIYVNGEHYGFFIAIEEPDDSYLERIYGEDNEVQAYKPESMSMGGGGFGGDMNPPENGDMTPPDAGAAAPEGGDVTPPDDGAAAPENGDDGTAESGAGGFPDISGIDFSDFDFSDFDPSSFDPSEFDFSDFDFSDFDFSDLQMPTGGMGGDNGVSLAYTDDDTESYSNIFDESITNPDDDDKARLIASLKGISESSGEELEQYINVDEVLRYTACNVFLVNLDSYFSQMGHNYILTEDDGVLSMLPWDYNLSFGTYQSGDSSSVINYAIDSVFSGVDAEERPIIGKLLENEEYLEKYHEYLRIIAEEYVDSGLFAQTVAEKAALIDEYVSSDTTSFDGYDAFAEGCTALALFGELRAQSVLAQLDGTIPATTEEQTDESVLIDSSSFDLSLLGGMNMGGGGQGGMGGGPEMHGQGGGEHRGFGGADGAGGTADAPAGEQPDTPTDEPEPEA